MNNTFCVMPFTHLNIKHEGKVSACWRFPDKLGDYNNETLTDIWNNSNIQKLRNDLLNNIKHKGCRSCWDLEDSNSTSTRETCAKTYDFLDKKQILKDKNTIVSKNYLKSIEIRFDNICNLMCRFCSPDYSSVWENAVKKDKRLHDKMIEYGTFRKNSNHIFLIHVLI